MRRVGRAGSFVLLVLRVAGDGEPEAALEQLEQLARQRVRSTDWVGRLEGREDEVVVLARDTRTPEAVALAEQLTKSAREAAVEVECTLYPFPPERSLRRVKGPSARP